MKITLCTILSLVAFAGNSVLNRLALGDNAIDAASFTVIRLLSGIIVLTVIVNMTRANSSATSKGSWISAAMLFLYALTFSYAYIYLETGIGALILFGTVQITMILASLVSGNRLHYFEWIGVLIAFAGFVYLVLPSLSTPSLVGFVLMTIAGISWAGYTLLGRGSQHPLSDTAYNFLRTLPFTIILLALTFKQANLSQEGVFLAVLSGAITSGLGYTIWYIALGGLSTTRAAVVQLLVPVIAAAGGVVFANEMITQRLVLSSLLILGGILAVVMGNYFISPTRSTEKNESSFTN